MKKLYVQEIEYCAECPNVHIDQNVTRYECRLSRYRFLSWLDDDAPIPEWCKLPNVKDEYITKEDFEI